MMFRLALLALVPALCSSVVFADEPKSSAPPVKGEEPKKENKPKPEDKKKEEESSTTNGSVMIGGR